MPRIIARFYCITLLLCGVCAHASTVPEVLPVDEAFALSVRRGAGRLEIRFRVAPGHYLYRDRLSVQRDGERLEMKALPQGTPKDDPHFGLVDVLHEGFAASILGSVGPEQFSVRYQGCAEAGFCYPPQKREFSISSDDTSLHISRDPRTVRAPLPF